LTKTGRTHHKGVRLKPKNRTKDKFHPLETKKNTQKERKKGFRRNGVGHHKGKDRAGEGQQRGTLGQCNANRGRVLVVKNGEGKTVKGNHRQISSQPTNFEQEGVLTRPFHLTQKKTTSPRSRKRAK